MTSGSRTPHDNDEDRAAHNDERQHVRAIDADCRREQRRGRSCGQAEQQTHRDEQQDGVVQVVAERVGTAGALRDQTRSDSRISALNAASIVPR